MCAFAPQLEKLALTVEQQQQGSGLRARASFLVLTQTLLLGLGDLSETQHLLTAQRVYTLLEPPLLENTRDDSTQVRWHGGGGGVIIRETKENMAQQKNADRKLRKNLI